MIDRLTPIYDDHACLTLAQGTAVGRWTNATGRTDYYRVDVVAVRGPWGLRIVVCDSIGWTAYAVPPSNEDDVLAGLPRLHCQEQLYNAGAWLGLDWLVPAPPKALERLTALAPCAAWGGWPAAVRGMHCLWKAFDLLVQFPTERTGRTVAHTLLRWGVSYLRPAEVRP